MLGSDHLINVFDDYCTSQEYDLPEEFKINQDTVQTFFKKSFNSVIQLDRNFILDVRTHDPNVQEKRLMFGKDEKGDFLKVYFTDVNAKAI